MSLSRSIGIYIYWRYMLTCTHADSCLQHPPQKKARTHTRYMDFLFLSLAHNFLAMCSWFTSILQRKRKYEVYWPAYDWWTGEGCNKRTQIFGARLDHYEMIVGIIQEKSLHPDSVTYTHGCWQIFYVHVYLDTHAHTHTQSILFLAQIT